MEQVFAQWRLRAALGDTRFIFTVLPEDPHEAYRQLTGFAGVTGRQGALRKPKPIDRLQFHDAVADGGFTYQPHGKYAPVTGYSVGVHPDHGGVASEVDLADLSPAHIAGHRREADHLFRGGYQGHTVHQGAWLDRTSGKVYLDTSHVEPEEKTARELGIHHRQLAYYDLNRGQSVYFDPNRDPDMRGTPEEREAAHAKYSRVQQEHGRVTPEGYWGYHHEYGPVPGEKEALAVIARDQASRHGLPLPWAPPSRYREYLRDHPTQAPK